MKVRLKLSYNEFRALVFILSRIALMEVTSVIDYIDVREAEKLAHKLFQAFNERPKKHYIVLLNSGQIRILWLFNGLLGWYEHSVLQDICKNIDKQYVSESHHRQMRIEAMFEEEQQLRITN